MTPIYYREISSEIMSGFVINKDILEKYSLAKAKDILLNNFNNLYICLKYGNNDDFLVNKIQSILPAIKKIIQDICFNADTKEAISSLCEDFCKTYLTDFNNMLFYYSEAFDIWFNSSMTPNVDTQFESAPYEMLLQDIRTSKKNVNMLYESDSFNHPVFSLFDAWTQKHPSINLKQYMFYTSVKSKDELKKHIYGLDFSKATKTLFGNRTNYRFSTNFDIGYLDFCCTANQLHLESLEYYRNILFHVNTHVKNGAPIIIKLCKTEIYYPLIKLIATYLDDINVYKNEKDLNILIVGTSNKQRNEDVVRSYNLLNKIYNDSEPEFIYDIFNNYDDNEIIFRSLDINEEDVESFIKSNSNILNKSHKNLEKTILGTNDNTNRQPLIPFNPGQLGLILVSGDIDGIVDEGNGYYHVIKGSVFRNPTVTNEIEPNNTQVRKITRNVSTAITVMLADGTITKLH